MSERRPERSTLSGSDVLATAVFVTALLWGLILCLEVVHGLFGIGGIVLGTVFFPVLLMTVPWYALIALGDPLPAMICSGGALLAWAFVATLGDDLSRTVRRWW